MEPYSLTFFASIVMALVMVITFHIQELRKRAVNPNNLPLPPGPRKLPFIGNALTFPTQYLWTAFASMAQQYGDIMHMSIFGQSVIVLGSVKATLDLLGKRSAKYSDRIQLPMLCGLLGWDATFVFMPYGDAWRRDRRAFHNFFMPTVITRYQPLQLRATHKFIRRLAETPENLYGHIRHLSASSILSITYGFELATDGDEFVQVDEQAMQSLAAAAIPGSFLVDVFPYLKYVPSWVPGASFQNKVKYWQPLILQLSSKPWLRTLAMLKEGTAQPCIVTGLMEDLENKGASQEEELLVRNMAGTAYAAASDTSASALYAFFLAIVMYPEVQRKAQAEIDRVIGGSRLPAFSDRPSLPYVDAIVSETLRWQPVKPLAIPHYTSESDEYEGYFIPKGSIVIANAWAILHDPDAYPEPEEFKPERFLKDGKLDPNVTDPRIAAFGFGRRICPGKHYSDNVLFIAIVSVLHLYNINPALDTHGNPIPVKAEMSTGAISTPKEFRCSITPRSAMATAQLIKDIET